MEVLTACIAGEEIYRQWEQERTIGRRIGTRKTPFGSSTEMFLMEGDGPAFYLLPRHAPGICKTAMCKVNNRANMYALKDVGVRQVLAWAPGGAITHNIAVGDLVVLDDLIDKTYLRTKTFFEDSALGFLRQFPVFCPTLRKAVSEALRSAGLAHHDGGTAAVTEGPRLETPAEIRMLAAGGAEVVTHGFVPEAFLAKELEMCYAAICYVVNYAETGSRHRPFVGRDLFGGLAQQSENHRLSGAMEAMRRIVSDMIVAVQTAARVCDCDKTMEYNKRQYNLPADWREWFV